MSYNKTTWHTGDLVSSTGLNNMEEGIANIDNVEIPELTRGLSGAKATIIVNDNRRFKINRYSISGTNYTQLIIPSEPVPANKTAQIFIDTYEGRKVITIDQALATQINTASGSSYASYDSSTKQITITITTNLEIIYKYLDNKIAIQYRDTMSPGPNINPNLRQGRAIDDICLLGAYYADIYGIAFENYLMKQLWDNGGNSSTIPELTRGLIGSKATITLNNVGQPGYGRFKINRYTGSDGTNYTQLIWKGNITLDSTGGRKTISASDAYDAVGDAYATYNSSTVTITITTNKEIVYKYSTNTIAIQYRDTVPDSQKQWSTYDPNLQEGRDIDDICLLGAYYEDIYGLALENYFIKQLWDGKGELGTTASKATVFLSDNGKFKFLLDHILDSQTNALVDYKKKVSWSNWLYILYNMEFLNLPSDLIYQNDGTRVKIEPYQVRDFLSGYSGVVQYDSNSTTVTVTIATGYELVYNLSSNSLKYQSRKNRKADDTVLLGSYYQTTYGLIWDEMNRRSVQDSVNSAPYTGLFNNWAIPLKRYHSLFIDKENIESFAFYTDSHVMGYSDNAYYEHFYTQYIKQVQKVYNTSACNFIVCGGDWLNQNTSRGEALHRLGMIKGSANSMMRNHHLLVGNHDTNYQGTTVNGILPTLTHDEMNNIWFNEENTRKSYYSFDGIRTKCYCFDTWDLLQTELGTYEKEQATWFANSLLEDNPERAICFIHAIYPDSPSSSSVNVLTDQLTAIANAFNTKSSITVDNVSYNFSSSTGKVYFFASGHTHRSRGPSTPTAAQAYAGATNDFIVNGIPCVATPTRGFRTELAIVALFLVDYDNNKLYITHADELNINGTNDSFEYGRDREFNI